MDGEREHRLLKQGHGETGFPHTLTWWEGLGGRSPPRKNLFHPVGVRRSGMDGWGEKSGAPRWGEGR